MKCVLVIPSWEPEEIFPTKTAASQINYWQPLGTLSVASSLLEAGHDVKFLNGAFLDHAGILDEIERYAPEFVGLYSTAFGWYKAVKTAEDIKKLIPGAFLAVGGPYPIAMKDKCLKDTDAIDAVVTGEGEFTVIEMIERLSEERSLHGVKGVAFRSQRDVIWRNPERDLIADLDSLPFPARELLGHDEYIPPPATYKRKPVAVIMTSRGCNRRCIFCFQMDRERKSGIRFRSVENVMKEIELCLAQGYREIKFIDDNFAADRQRARNIAREIKKQGLDFTWFASACVHHVDLEMLSEFKDAGCWAILMGAESGVQKDLNTLKKGITVEQIRKAVTVAKQAGLRVFTPFLFGIPGQTYEDGLRSIDFACEIDPDVANFHALTPFPGTELYDKVDDYGWMSDNLADLTYQGSAFVPYTMSRKQISDLRQVAFRRFYSRPRFLLRRVIGLRSLNDLIAAYRGIKSLFWIMVKKGLFKRPEPEGTNL
ncbi:MAG: radical SAM protein [Nitrospirota bacterium]|nr:MAG: radical SAM protein [Nitrospirota bacterium]